MTTLHKERGFCFRVYPNDHQPAHIHAVTTDGDLKISIVEDEPYPLDLKGKMSGKKVGLALDITEIHIEKFRAEWERFHGCIIQSGKTPKAS